MSVGQIGTTGFSPWFHLPGFHFGYPFLTHSHVIVLSGGAAAARGTAAGERRLAVERKEVLAQWVRVPKRIRWVVHFWRVVLTPQ